MSLASIAAAIHAAESAVSHAIRVACHDEQADPAVTERVLRAVEQLVDVGNRLSMVLLPLENDLDRERQEVADRCRDLVNNCPF